MRSRVENWFGVPFRITVFNEGDAVVLEGARKLEGQQVAGPWVWKPLTKAAQFVISGCCRRCACYQLRSLGWASSACLPGQFHVWQSIHF